MSILEQEVLVSLVGKFIKYYEELCYEIPKYIDKQGRIKAKTGTKIYVKTEHLPNKSNVKVTKICDVCKKITPNLAYHLIVASRARNNGIDLCLSCSGVNTHKERRENLPFEKSLFATNPEIAKCLKYPENGYALSSGSHRREDFVCPECNFEIKNKIISNVVLYGLSCPRCSDGLSYPEKFVFSVLSQLQIEFDYQKVLRWAENKRYDFYIHSSETIVEVNGGQHYGIGFELMGGISLEDQKSVDNAKKELAIKNGIKNYIVIDCSRSEPAFVKESILKSKLSELFNLDEIDWLNCHEYACNSSVKIACDLWNSGIRNVTKIGELMKVRSGTTVRKYLKHGAELGWCDYDSRKIMSEVGKRRNDTGRKPIVILSLDGSYINEYKSKTYASKKLGIYLFGISQACEGKRDQVKGFKFMFKSDYEKKMNQSV